MKKKKMMAVLAAGMAVAMLAACSNNSGESVDSGEEEEREVAVATLLGESDTEEYQQDSEEDREPVKGDTVSSDWQDLEFLLDGYTFDLDDMQFHELSLLGWSYDTDRYKNPVLSGSTYATSYMVAVNEKYDSMEGEDSVVKLLPVNYTSTSRTAAECDIIGISVGERTQENADAGEKPEPEFYVAEGIHVGSEQKEAVDAFGTDYEASDQDGDSVMEYNSQQGTLRLYIKDEKVCRIELEKNMQ